MTEIFPAFRHAPFVTAGFNPFSLPMHYEDRGGDGDANEALAMSFLLSSALDWGEGNYCSRHAYFVFKRCRRHMPALMKSYEPKLVSHLVTDVGSRAEGLAAADYDLDGDVDLVVAHEGDSEVILYKNDGVAWWRPSGR